MGLSGDPETGFQVIWDAPRLKLDSWINWESFIYRNDTHQESFSFGTSLRLLTNSSDSRLHVYFPVQTIFQHRGGEINTEAEERQVKTWMNAAGGVGMTLNTLNSIVPWINLEACGVYYKTMLRFPQTCSRTALGSKLNQINRYQQRACSSLLMR